jgi:hypothetical protein
VKHPPTSSIRRVCPEPAVNRGHASPTVRVLPDRHVLSLRVVSRATPIFRITACTTSWSRGHLTPPLSGVRFFLCPSLALGCSQRHAVLGGLLIRRSNTPLKFTSDHTGLYLLTRERPHRADIFLSPRTQLGSLLRHLCSLIRSRISDHRKPKARLALANSSSPNRILLKVLPTRGIAISTVSNISNCKWR